MIIREYESETRRSGAFEVGDDCIFEGIGEPLSADDGEPRLKLHCAPPWRSLGGGLS